MIVSEPWNGGSVHQHAVESGPEPDNCGHVGDVFRILHDSERQSYRRETQSEFSCFRRCVLVRYIKISSEKHLWGERTVSLNILLCFLEFPAGSVREVGPYEQSEASAACFGQKWLPLASRVPLRIQGVAASDAAEDDAAQSRELHAELEQRWRETLTPLNPPSRRLNSFSSSCSRFLSAVCCVS